MRSPWACLAIVGFYLYFVHELGPNLMAKRKPFKLERVMQIYNAVQIVLCAYVLHKVNARSFLFELESNKSNARVEVKVASVQRDGGHSKQFPNDIVDHSWEISSSLSRVFRH